MIIVRFRIVAGSRCNLAILAPLTYLRVELIPEKVESPTCSKLLRNGANVDCRLPKSISQKCNRTPAMVVRYGRNPCGNLGCLILADCQKEKAPQTGWGCFVLRLTWRMAPFARPQLIRRPRTSVPSLAVSVASRGCYKFLAVIVDVALTHRQRPARLRHPAQGGKTL